mgnify:CR=1 FL=1
MADCIEINELLSEYNISRKELQMLASKAGVFLLETDSKICGVSQYFFDLLKEFAENKERIEKEDIAEIDKKFVDIFNELGYTVIKYYDNVYATNKYRIMDRETVRRYVRNKKDMNRVIFFAGKTLVPEDVYKKILEAMKEERKRAETIVLDINEIEQQERI